MYNEEEKSEGLSRFHILYHAEGATFQWSPSFKLSIFKKALDRTKPYRTLGYFTASAASTLPICYVALFAGLLYLATLGWTLAFSDILLLLLDVLLPVLFGTSPSSLINCNLSTNGQASAVGTIVSAGYVLLQYLKQRKRSA